MAILKYREIKRMSEKDRTSKIKELKIELAKNKANASKSGAGKTKEIKKTIARLITINKSNKNEEQPSKKKKPLRKEELAKK